MDFSVRDAQIDTRLLSAGLALVAALGLVVVAASPAAAANNAPGVYSHSWYLRAEDATTMYNLGVSDGAFDNGSCSNSFVFLDFGQVTQLSGPGYGGYGTYDFDFAAGSKYVSDSTIVSAVENYALGWYNATSACPRLNVALGTNNYIECPAPPYSLGSCTPNAAGVQWAQASKDVQSWLSANGYSWQVSTQSGDDIETGWDCASRTRPFVDGYGTISTTGLYDYGDAWLNAPCWTDGDVYYVAYGALPSWPFPEIYSQAAADRWTAVRQSYSMNIQGVMTECRVADPLPQSNCNVNGHTEFAPSQAWNALVNDLNNHGVGGSNMTWATNIKFQ